MLKTAAFFAVMATAASADAGLCENEKAAYKAATDYVMFQLKSPFSAEFPPLGAEYVSAEIIGECEFLISSYTDARNSLGKTVRQGFSLTITYETKTSEWIARGLKTTDPAPSSN